MYMNDKVSKISIVGAGMVATPGITFKMFRSLADANINFLILFRGNRQIPGLATGAVGHSLFYSRR